jgi:hypothetical protein
MSTLKKLQQWLRGKRVAHWSWSAINTMFVLVVVGLFVSAGLIGIAAKTQDPGQIVIAITCYMTTCLIGIMVIQISEEKADRDEGQQLLEMIFGKV